jgi:hypothetical protein
MSRILVSALLIALLAGCGQTVVASSPLGISYGSVDRVWLRENGQPWGM